MSYQPYRSKDTFLWEDDYGNTVRAYVDDYGYTRCCICYSFLEASRFNGHICGL